MPNYRVSTKGTMLEQLIKFEMVDNSYPALAQFIKTQSKRLERLGEQIIEENNREQLIECYRYFMKKYFTQNFASYLATIFETTPLFLYLGQEFSEISSQIEKEEMFASLSEHDQHEIEKMIDGLSKINDEHIIVGLSMIDDGSGDIRRVTLRVSGNVPTPYRKELNITLKSLLADVLLANGDVFITIEYDTYIEVIAFSASGHCFVSMGDRNMDRLIKTFIHTNKSIVISSL